MTNFSYFIEPPLHLLKVLSIIVKLDTTQPNKIADSLAAAAAADADAGRLNFLTFQFEFLPKKNKSVSRWSRVFPLKTSKKYLIFVF